jgi:hypothetical protein
MIILNQCNQVVRNKGVDIGRHGTVDSGHCVSKGNCNVNEETSYASSRLLIRKKLELTVLLILKAESSEIKTVVHLLGKCLGDKREEVDVP